MPPSQQAKEVADAAYGRYLTDAEFHAQVFRAAQIAQVAMDPERAAFIETEFMLGAAVALHLAGNAGSTQGGDLST